MVPHILLLLLLNPHIRTTFHSYLLPILKNLHPHLLVILKTQKNMHPHIQKIHEIFHPHLLQVLKKEKLASPHLQDTKYSIPTTTPTTTSSSFSSSCNTKTYTTKWKRSKQSYQSRYIGPNTSVIGPGETPLLPVNQSDVLADADKSIDDI
jgi:hypothetical protein